MTEFPEKNRWKPRKNHNKYQYVFANCGFSQKSPGNIRANIGSTQPLCGMGIALL